MSRETGILLLVGAYAALCHWRASVAPDAALTAILMLGPMAAGLAAAALRLPVFARRLALALLAVTIGAAAWLFDDTGAGRWLYLIQHVSINGLLGLVFATSLLPPRTPITTMIARRIHGRLPPEIERYTRAFTLAWTVFFALLCAASIALFVWAPIEAWSWLANVGTPLGVAILFLGDFALRRRLFPGFDHVGLGGVLRAVAASRRDGIAS